jgi:hypothetical protein
LFPTSRCSLLAQPLFSLSWQQNSSTMTSRRREYHVDCPANKAAIFFVACEPNTATRVKIPDAMRIRWYSQNEATDRGLHMQVHCEAEKIKGEAIPSPPTPEAAAVCAAVPIDHSKCREGSTCGDNSCSGGWPHLAGSRGGRSSITAQEDAKNVASGADCAAEQVEAQGRPGTGTCACYYWQLPTAATAEERKNLWFKFLMHVCDTRGRFGCDEEWVWPCTIGCSTGHSPTYPQAPRGSHRCHHSREEVLHDGGQAHHIRQHVQVCQDRESKCGGSGEGGGQEAAFGVLRKA